MGGKEKGKLLKGTVFVGDDIGLDIDRGDVTQHCESI